MARQWTVCPAWALQRFPAFVSDPLLWLVYCHCVAQAAAEPITVAAVTGRGAARVSLAPGEFLYGRHQWAEALGLAPSTLQRRVARLDNQADRHVILKPDTHFTVGKLIMTGCCEIVDVAPGQARGQASGQALGHPNLASEDVPPVPSKPRVRQPKPKHPAPPVVEALRLGLGRYPAREQWAAIEAHVNGHVLDLPELTRHAAEWAARGWNRANFIGAIEYHLQKAGGGRPVRVPETGGGIEGALRRQLRRLDEREERHGHERGDDSGGPGLGALPVRTGG